MKFSVKKLVTMAVLAALSIVLMMFIKFPIIPAAPYLIYEPADVPILIGSFLFGPLAGLVITGIVSAIQTLTSSSGNGLVGFFMHVAATGTFVITAGLIYKKFHNVKGAIIALAVGTLAMTAIMIPVNLIVQPNFFGVPIDVVKSLLLPAILPFNLIKAGLNSVLTFIVYKRISNIVHKLAE